MNRRHVAFVPLFMLLSSMGFCAEEARTIVLRAVDAETGEGIPAVTFAKENIYAEEWGRAIGATDEDGYLRISLPPKRRLHWWYWVWNAPQEYVWYEGSEGIRPPQIKVDARDEVYLAPKPGETIKYTFKLRRCEEAKAPEAKRLTKEDRASVPEPKRIKQSNTFVSQVTDMPGFEGKPIEIRFDCPRTKQVTQEQRDWAAKVVRGGEQIAKFAREELMRFQAAEPNDAGRFDEMRKATIEIGQIPEEVAPLFYWKLELDLPGDAVGKYQFHFKRLDACDLRIPAHHQRAKKASGTQIH